MQRLNQDSGVLSLYNPRLKGWLVLTRLVRGVTGAQYAGAVRLIRDTELAPRLYSTKSILFFSFEGTEKLFYS